MLTRLLVVSLLVFLTLGQRGGRGKGNAAKEGARKEAVREGAEDKRESVKDADPVDSSMRSKVPLPKQTELMQDENVEFGPVYRRFSGDDNSQVSCRGTVHGLTPEGGRPYFRYIKVNTSSCLQRNIIYPDNTQIMLHEVDSVFELWNITVTRLIFAGDDKKMAFKIPKRISKPGKVVMETGYSDDQYRGMDKRDEMLTYFGFAAFFPPMDQQVKWTVEWQVEACRPHHDSCTQYHRDRQVTYDKNAFPITDDGFEVWDRV